MRELFLRRRENLRRLVKDRGGQRRFLEEVGYTKGWLSQLIGRTPGRDLSEKIAREIEHKLGITSGALDCETTQEAEPGKLTGSEVSKLLGENLRKLMGERRVNQAELARRAKMPVTSVNRVFNAVDNNVSLRVETLAGIARGLGVHASELLKPGPTTAVPAPHEPPFTTARQLSRLIEDFLLCTPTERIELLRLAAESSGKSGGRRVRRTES